MSAKAELLKDAIKQRMAAPSLKQAWMIFSTDFRPICAGNALTLT